MTKFRSKNGTFSMSDGLRELNDRIIEDKYGHFLRAAGAELDEIEAGIQAQWPVKTGASRAGFTRERVVSTQAAAVRLVNAVPYAGLVRRKSFAGAQPSFQTLVRKPALDNLWRLARRAALELGRAARE